MIPVEEWPFGLTVLALWFVALGRGGATYWLARGIRAGGARSRWARHLDRPSIARAELLVKRFGAPAVSVSFLTVGIQTAVNAASGLLRMPLRRYLPALALGAAAWSVIYATIGMAVFEAWVGHARWWWWVVGAAAIVVVVLSTRRLRRAERVSTTSMRTGADATHAAPTRTAHPPRA